MRTLFSKYVFWLAVISLLCLLAERIRPWRKGQKLLRPHLGQDIFWHHEKKLRGKAGVNFAVVFSLWDWLFRTAYMPRKALQPDALGFGGMEKVPADVFRQFVVPWMSKS